MLTLFRAISDRLAALLATHVVLNYEQQLLRHHSDRKAELLRQARQLEDEGWPELATELREQVDQLSLERLLAATPSSTDELFGHLSNESTAAPPETTATARLKHSTQKRRKAK